MNSIVPYFLMFLVGILSQNPPPKLPYKYTAHFNVTFDFPPYNFTAIRAEDSSNQLLLFEINQSSFGVFTQLYNENISYTLEEKKLEQKMCNCNNRTYTESGLPYFHNFLDFVVDFENDDFIWWDCIYHGSDGRFYNATIRVSRNSPDIPDSIKFHEMNTTETYLKFDTSEPDKELFDIPHMCRDIEKCH